MDEIKKLRYELGRYQKKVNDQSEAIKKLQETIAGYAEREDVNYAMITAVVEQTGAVTIGRDRISEILNDSIHTIVDYDADKRTYTLRLMGGETDGGSPSEQN